MFKNFAAKIGWVIFLFKWGQVLLAPMTKTVLCKGRLPAGLTFKCSLWWCLLQATSRFMQGSHLAGQWCAFCTRILVPAFQMIALEIKWSLAFSHTKNFFRKWRMESGAAGWKVHNNLCHFYNLWGLNYLKIKKKKSILQGTTRKSTYERTELL